MNPLIRIGIVFACVLILAACGRDTRDLEQWVAQVQQRPAEPIEPIPPMKEPEPMIYAAHDVRDPFARGRARTDEERIAAGVDGVRPDPDRRREYLEDYPLDTLNMVGTIEMDAQVWALLSDREGVVHRVREGNYIGQNHGRVHQIRADRVELVELIPDGEGWMEREAQIALVEGRREQQRTRRRR